MSFSLGLLLIPYLLAILLFLVLAVLNVYHLIRYGATTGTSFVFTFIFMAGAVIIAFVSWQMLAQIDWTTSVGFSLYSSSAADLPQI
ncbi:hypothetical protein KKF05_05220 [Patescibacteria group bacterium]|nr:hypothetical protein [Patescibacteria group bacterium]MBU1029448.1 hypothetical protein [Patescibacteria group bacterium]MBU1916236.1 hypothetical protein [Patescibacteria group bacterium]